MQRPRPSRCGMTLRHRYDDVGLPCRNTMGSPAPGLHITLDAEVRRLRCGTPRPLGAPPSDITRPASHVAGTHSSGDSDRGPRPRRTNSPTQKCHQRRTPSIPAPPVALDRHLM